MWCWSTSRSPSARIVEVEGAMSRDELEHVVEKADAGVHVVPALAFQADPHVNPRFLGRSID